MVQALNTLNLVLVLILVAMGLALIFGVMGIVNLAHGEFFMLGAYGAVAAIGVTGSFWVALVVAPLAVAALGLAVEVSLIRFLYNRPMESLLATWGLALFLRESVQIVAGRGYQRVDNPLPGAVDLGVASYPAYRVFSMGTIVVVVAIVYWLLARTDVGIWLRAAIENPQMASALGIHTKRLYRATFAAGAGLAALAGALMAPLISITPGIGLTVVIDAFLVVIVGGLGSLAGTIAGGAIIGGTDGIAQYFTDPVVAGVLVLVVAILVIRLRPSGLVGR